ncbi:MAG TPA: bifunctional diaminohydroxyphosphoribosylaminopyrimidine deaminase/5-amino-6-(5-phosphoribosylamino)uracil reductase RibD [Solirubrobacterales bacterium]|nr:bifunctional diaminohydroxyphosphoribosylaminopyrimidine deaminase/5-amino-6-(5-phosphoribosylamino)uracil reductase RibD [Solirubrobacterales bacterium]HNN18988.1 bifunctional diaminohydroxyphosphoribosylaminopyrimidine deaminase/5-amino-6-(5-phosphoribosylamino)uracil reductase RibD [Solirubrobacterales bacterium]
MPAAQPTSEADYWQRAIQLAEHGLGWTSPNPAVGAVLVKDGRVIGEGWHRRHGELHAEREALADAERRGNDPAGATIFVTLEPCAHTGSQPPCADGLIEAGVGEVVIAAGDPTEKTRGVGPARLEDAGIRVRWAEGPAADAALALIQDFRKRALTGKPLVTLKMAMSLDGKVATRTGDSKWISGEESRALVHRWRAEMDAVAVGSGTLTADDPRLTARHTDGEPVRQPARVIFDSGLLITTGAALFADIDEAPLLIIAGPEPDPDRLAALKAAGAEVIPVAGEGSGARFALAMEALGERGIGSLLLEGGPRLAGAALTAGEVDRTEIFIAPLILGGGRPATEGSGPELMEEATRVPKMRIGRVGQDVLMSSTIRTW